MKLVGSVAIVWYVLPEQTRLFKLIDKISQNFPHILCWWIYYHEFVLLASGWFEANLPIHPETIDYYGQTVIGNLQIQYTERPICNHIFNDVCRQNYHCQMNRGANSTLALQTLLHGTSYHNRLIDTLCYTARHLYGLTVPLLPFSLTAGHRQCMLAYWHQNWNNQHWSHVISVEFRVSLYNYNGHAWVFFVLLKG